MLYPFDRKLSKFPINSEIFNHFASCNYLRIIFTKFLRVWRLDSVAKGACEIGWVFFNLVLRMRTPKWLQFLSQTHALKILVSFTILVNGCERIHWWVRNQLCKCTRKWTIHIKSLSHIWLSLWHRWKRRKVLAQSGYSVVVVVLSVRPKRLWRPP